MTVDRQIDEASGLRATGLGRSCVSTPSLPHGGRFNTLPCGGTEGKTEMATDTAIETVATAKAAGYQAATVAARIADMDLDAAGNAEKAAWKRYLTLALLAMAKNVDKKKLIEAVFGRGGKPSKNFQNMWSIAANARNTVLGNRDWDDIRSMAIDDAVSNVILSINAHMSQLGVSGKNDYASVCNLSVSEAARFFEQKAADKAAADAAAAAEKAEKAETDKTAETEAQATATATPERTAAEAAIGALAEAGQDDLMQVAAFIVSKIEVENMILMRDALENMIANAARTINGPAANAA